MGRLVERSDPGLAVLESRKSLDLFSDLLLGETQLVETLKVQPKLRAGPKEMCETQGSVPRDSALAVEYLGDAVGRDAEVARKLGGAHVERCQFFGEMLTGMDGDARHVQSLLVVVHNFYVHGTRRAFWPFEAYSPLVVDADAILASTVAHQRLKMVTGQSGKVLKRQGHIETVELQARRALEAGEGFDSFAGREVSAALVPIADDHYST
ncbi:protein of unknown function [Candidatus Methylomirabilis oxygeniifera]|uniref:Uncharacterized protein n=1 Tax=Methylomirabilis oxygeniifera TaxID=671143 RepID=D5MG70_METO1|nr:protein of unknown function [Candidatus Methylomirabilis oxyfera]